MFTSLSGDALDDAVSGMWEEAIADIRGSNARTSAIDKANGAEAAPDGGAPSATASINKEEIYEHALLSDDVRYFYSFGTDNDDLSSMAAQYSFWGAEQLPAWAAAAAPSGVPSFLEGRLQERHFTTREHFFQYAKTLFAAQGRFKEENEARAAGLLSKTAREAHNSTQKIGSLRGLDASAWDKESIAVMELGAATQAAGCRDFEERLLGTGDALLAEAKMFGKNVSAWGIGFSQSEAARMPAAARAQGWGRNEHGRLLMLVRAALRAARARGDG